MLVSRYYVYRTKRGLLRSVVAPASWMAWGAACQRRHAPQVLYRLDGAGWVANRVLGCLRQRAADVPPGHARALYLDACAAEVPVAAEEMAGLARGKYIAAPALRRILAARGLITLDGADCALTDLGRAFVARTEGGA